MDDDATELGHGCCSHGAHFADKADREAGRCCHRSRSTDAQWQFRAVAEELGGAIQRNDDGDWVTRTHDGACIMLNRATSPAASGVPCTWRPSTPASAPMDYKPEVCWQLPLRLTHHLDEVEHSTHTLREWKRRDWGEGGAEFHWWCTEGPEAFIVEDERCSRPCATRSARLVGEEVYRAAAARRSSSPPGGHPGAPSRRAADGDLRLRSAPHCHRFLQASRPGADGTVVSAFTAPELSRLSRGTGDDLPRPRRGPVGRGHSMPAST